MAALRDQVREPWGHLGRYSVLGPSQSFKVKKVKLSL